MDLDGLQDILHANRLLEGSSDPDLVVDVMNAIDKAKDLELPDRNILPAAGLIGGIRLRAIEALHRLAYASRPPYPDDLIELYLRWAPLRYLGFFDHNKDEQLVVSKAGRAMRGNQRRVASEELGIGFAIRIAEQWVRNLGYAGGMIDVIDIDVLRDRGFVEVGGVPLDYDDEGRHPDYLLIAAGPEVRQLPALYLLECKGTATAGYPVKQLARAVTQLDGVTIGRYPLPSLAVSTLTGSGPVRYYAVELEAGERAPSRTVGDRLPEEVIGRPLPPRLDLYDLTDLALPTAWTSLALFGGNVDAAAEWDQGLDLSDVDEQPTRPFATTYGRAWGIVTESRLRGRTIVIKRGIDEAVNARLSAVDYDGLLAAQARFARALAERGDPASRVRRRPGGELRVESAAPNGSVLSITVR